MTLAIQPLPIVPVVNNGIENVFDDVTINALGQGNLDAWCDHQPRPLVDGRHGK